MTGVPSYSTVASENVNANTGIVWDEGMAPAEVNNSARQNMADMRSQWNDASWFQYGNGSKTVAHTYASSTSTTIATDVTTYYHVGRRIKAVGSGTGTIYGQVASSSYSAPNTTINYTWDSGSLSNETLTIYTSIFPVTGHPVGPAPTRQVLTSGSSATYTTPSGCRQLKIRMYGGGGGGGGGGDNGVHGGTGGGGGTTIFNSIQAVGGALGSGGFGAGGTNPGAGGTGGTGSASFRFPGQSGGPGTGAPNPTIGSAVGGPGGGQGGGTASSNGATNTGGGGGGGGVSGTATGSSGGGGGQGEYAEIIINNPTATYTYTVGAGGTAGVAGNGGGVGGAGGTGVIIVEEIY